jgi:hypothetical protein
LIPEFRDELLDLVREHKPEKKAIAVVVKPEVWGETKCRAPRNIPGEDGAEIVRSIGQAKAMNLAKAAIHFGTEREVFAAKIAGLSADGQSESAAGAEGVAKLPRLASKIFLGNEIFGNIPCLEIAGEDELEFGLALFFAAIVAGEKVFASVVADDFEQSLVGRVDIFELEI